MKEPCPFGGLADIPAKCFRKSSRKYYCRSSEWCESMGSML